MPASGLPAHLHLTAIVVGGGTGRRFGGPLPKQFLLLGGKPVLVHTLERFLHFHPALRIALVLPADYFHLWHELQPSYLSAADAARIELVAGGSIRTESVHNGLRAIAQWGLTPEHTLVAVQDAVRPFCSPQMIAACYASAWQQGSGVCAVPSKSSLRMITPNGSVAVDRSQYLAVQTPQTFQYAQLLAAYQQQTGEYTDDASLAEAAGMAIHLVEGSYDNIKLTTPEDLVLAEQLLPKFLDRVRAEEAAH